MMSIGTGNGEEEEGCFRKRIFVGMKRFLAILLLSTLIGCNEKPEKPASAKPLVRDTNNLPVRKEPANPYLAVDVSPMDMAYLPVDYPKLPVKRPLPVARVIYSRPHKQGRALFGELLKYGEPWRLGANESSEIEFFQPVTIQDKTVPAGRYIIYCIPEAASWIIVLNSNLHSWGLNIDTTKDRFRFTIPIQNKQMLVEYFTMVFQPSSKGADLVMAWDNVEARLPIQYTER